MQKTKTTGLVWFKNNLRVRDNKALWEAVQRHEKVVGIYYLPQQWLELTPWGFKKMECFRAKFLLQTLSQLQKDLADLNISLWVTVGNWNETLEQLQKKHHITDLYGQYEWTQEEENDAASIPMNIQTHWYYDQFLFHPDDIPMEISNIPEVFTVFRKKCEKQSSIRPPFGIPKSMPKENLLNEASSITITA
jgi:deoxyribodipyrimidine photo-lyase